MAPREKIELCDHLYILVAGVSGDLDREAKAKVGDYASKYQDDARMLINRAQELIAEVDHMADIDSEHADRWYELASDLFLLGSLMGRQVTSPISSLSEAAKKYSEKGTARSNWQRELATNRRHKWVLDAAQRYKDNHDGIYKVKGMVDHIIGLQIKGVTWSRGYLEERIAKWRRKGLL
jgi:hypothetical protein